MADVSAIIPSYNHGRFVLDAIRSVLAQDSPVKEVIVVDDGSHDDSVERISSLDDPRVRLISFGQNRGACAAMNAGISAATSPLIAVCNSDDVWRPDKLTCQLRVLASQPETSAVFSDVTWIDIDGQAQPDAVVPRADIFRMANRTRHEWLRYLVESRNCLCHPSLLIQRAIYDRVGLYDNRYRQLPDLQMWLRVLQHYEIFVVEERLISFRLHDNTSRPSPSNTTRDYNEFWWIMLEFFRSLSADNFRRTFGSIRDPASPGYSTDVEKIMYLWSAEALSSPVLHWVAQTLTHEFLATAEGQAAWEGYGLTIRDAHILNGISTPWRDARRMSSFSQAELSTLKKICPTGYPGGAARAGAGVPWGKRIERAIRRVRKSLVARDRGTAQRDRA